MTDLDFDLDDVLSAIEKEAAGGQAPPAVTIQIDDSVISWYDENAVRYGGPCDDAAWTTFEFGVLSDRRPVRKCPQERVAPADTPIPLKDPRVSVVKLSRGEYVTWIGPWQLQLPGQKAECFKTRRDAVATGLRRLAIIDWHAKHAAPVVDQPVHEYVEVPDDKYKHLVTGSCVCGGWRFTGSANPVVVRAGYGRHLPDRELAHQPG